MKKLEEEFESIGKGEWWWLEKANPNQREKWYRLNAGKNRWEHMFKDSSGKPQVYPLFSATYEILGLDKADQDVILSRMRPSANTVNPTKSTPSRVRASRYLSG